MVYCFVFSKLNVLPFNTLLTAPSILLPLKMLWCAPFYVRTFGTRKICKLIIISKYITNYIAYYYVINIQNDILSACKKQGFELVIHPCDSTKPDIIEEITNMVKKSRIAGLVLTPPFSESPEIVEQIKLCHTQSINW